jgi:hypothetical protein
MKSKKALTTVIRDYMRDAICVTYYEPTQEELNTIEEDLCFPFALRTLINQIQDDYAIYYISIAQSIKSSLDRYLLVAKGEDGFIGLLLHNNNANRDGYGNFNSNGSFKTFNKKDLVQCMVWPMNQDLDGEGMYGTISTIIDSCELYYEKIKIMKEKDILETYTVATQKKAKNKL